MEEDNFISLVKKEYERVTGNEPFTVEPTIENGNIVGVFVCERPSSEGLARYADIPIDSRLPERTVRRCVEVYVDNMLMKQ